MANFRNHKPFMTGKFDEADERVAQHELIRPETISKALLREAATNAKMTGNDMIMTLHAKVGLPMWLIDVAKTMSYHLLELWHAYLKQGYLTDRGVTLQQVECMLNIKHYIMEEILTQPTEEETKKDNFKSTIETAVARECHRPQRSNNKNFTPEKGSYKAPDYDGKDNEYDLQTNLWVIPTEICQWVKDDEGNFVQGPTIIKIETLKQLYRSNLQNKKKDAGIPIHLLKQEVKDWIRQWRPCVAEQYDRPNKERRNEIQTYKTRELRKLRDAVRYMENGNGKLFWRMAFGYLGKYAKVEIEDLSLEKRIEAQIRRKYQNKKTRVEGIAYLPPVAAGDLLRPMLQERIELLVSKNKKFDPKWPWVIKVYFDAEAREHRDGDGVVTAGAGMMLQIQENKKEREQRLREMAESEENDE